MPDPRCETCRWWCPKEPTCRRFPPKVVLMVDHDASERWPLAWVDDWCGEHEPREKGGE